MQKLGRNTRQTPGRNTKQEHKAGTPGRHTRQTHQADTSGRHTRQKHQADTPGRHTRQTRQAETPGRNTRHTPGSNTRQKHQAEARQKRQAETPGRSTRQEQGRNTRWKHRNIAGCVCTVPQPGVCLASQPGVPAGRYFFGYGPSVGPCPATGGPDAFLPRASPGQTGRNIPQKNRQTQAGRHGKAWTGASSATVRAPPVSACLFLPAFLQEVSALLRRGARGRHTSGPPVAGHGPAGDPYPRPHWLDLDVSFCNHE